MMGINPAELAARNLQREIVQPGQKVHRAPEDNITSESTVYSNGDIRKPKFSKHSDRKKKSDNEDSAFDSFEFEEDASLAIIGDQDDLDGEEHHLLDVKV
jgi:hypothetical protein